MNVSIDWVGCYLEHKPFFDELALSMQKAGHKVGILTGERESRKKEILNSLGFIPDFICVWGDTETIGSASRWKAEKMIDLDIIVHYDDDARDLKLFTPRWVIKTMNNDEKGKF